MTETELEIWTTAFGFSVAWGHDASNAAYSAHRAVRALNGPAAAMSPSEMREAAVYGKQINSQQRRVDEWMALVFTEAERVNAPERALRTVEEAIELTQALGVDAGTVHRLVDYVFSRPVGDPAQEIAGTLITLLSTASAIGAYAQAAFDAEMTRVHRPEVIERCQRRQHEKRVALAPPNERLPP